MAEWLVGATAEFDSVERKIVSIGDREVGVFKVDGRYYAYENRCMHQGGPICEGMLIGKVEAVLEDDRNVVNEVFNTDEMHIACPWHGYEYDIRSGECAAEPSLRLRKYDVVERDETLYVVDR